MWEMTTTLIVPQSSGKLMIVAFIAGGHGSRVYCKVGHPHLAMVRFQPKKKMGQM
jgi:hypothetical protein